MLYLPEYSFYLRKPDFPFEKAVTKVLRNYQKKAICQNPEKKGKNLLKNFLNGFLIIHTVKTFLLYSCTKIFLKKTSLLNSTIMTTLVAGA